MKRHSIRFVMLSVVLAGASVASADTVYESPSMTSALNELLAYNYMADNSADGTVFWWRNVVQRDGSPIRIYFQSENVAPGYSVCFRWEFVDDAGDWQPRHFCESWFDTKLHSREILTAEEAARIKTFTVENFDVNGNGSGWDGVGRPSGTLAHQKKWHRFEDLSAKYNTVYADKRITKGTPEYEKLLYSTVADAEGQPNLNWNQTTITRDGTDIRVYFRSNNAAPDSAVCFRWRYVDAQGDWQPRHFCSNWFDTHLHSFPLLSASEAKRIKIFHLHTFDVAQTNPSWNGQGSPQGMLSHQYTAYTLVDPPTSAPPSSASRSTPRRSNADDRALLAVGKCALQYLGEQACTAEVEKHLGQSIGGLTCAAFLQKTFDGRIDPGELALGALADAASNSKSDFWRFVGGATKVGLFAKCVDDNR